MTESVSDFIRHVPCAKCGSSDACGIYSDGHTYCFSCTHYGPPMSDTATAAIEEAPAPPTAAGLLPQEDIEFVPLLRRGISQDTCAKYHYGTTTYGGRPCQVAQYFDKEGVVCAQKLRFQNKEFIWLGEPKKSLLFGQQLYGSGKYIIVTEGEIDTLSVSTAQGDKWATVSIRNGAAGAAKNIAEQMDYLTNFGTVVLMFDMDPPGQKAAQECAAMFPPGKCKIAYLSEKDANEMLLKGKGEELIKAVFNAKTFRPDGVLGSAEVLDRIKTRKVLAAVVHYPFPKLEAMTRGIRVREIHTITAGSGIGKSEFARAIGYAAVMAGEKLGYIGLEESVERSAIGLVGLSMAQRLTFHDDPSAIPGFDEAWKKVIEDKVVFYDHFGSTESDNLLQRIRFMRQSEGCRIILLDHLSIVVSGLEGQNERISIDKTMTDLKKLAQETETAIILVSHLKRPPDKAHEEGGRTTLAQLRGSAGIAQLSDIVIGLERNQQDPETAHLTRIRVLKNRFTGMTGAADAIAFDSDTGLFSVSYFPDEPEEPVMPAAPKPAGDSEF